MTALVTRHLPLVAGAPGGLSQLRMLLLRLAIQGRLVPQCAEEGTGQDVLDEVERERNSCGLPSTKIPKVRSGAVSNNDGARQPSNWVNARVGDVVLSIKSGGTPNKSNPDFWGGEIPWASVKDLNVARDLVSTQDFITDAGLAEGSKLAAPGDLLICTRMGLGKIAVAKVAVAFNQDLKGVRLARAVDVDYFINYYRTLSIQGSGMTVAGIKQDELLNFSLPLPPLAEQQRIVAKVDELMALCDRLEADQADAEAAHSQLVQALLDSLTQSTDAADFRASWQRLSEHFHTLFTTEASIDALKQTVLQLAVKGALSRRLKTDVPASKLLQEIAADTSSYCIEFKAPKPVVLPVSADDEPFAIPDSWRWTRLQSLFRVITDGDHQAPPRSESGVAFLTIGNVSGGRLEFEGCREVESCYFAELAAYRKPAKGDLLYTVVGATYGRPIVVDTDRAFCVQRHIAILKRSDLLEAKFALYLLASPFVYSQATSCITGTAQPTVPLKPLRNIVVPLPPYAEQRRIVAKVDELMALCDQVKAQLTEARQQHAQLASVLVEQAVA